MPPESRAAKSSLWSGATALIVAAGLATACADDSVAPPAPRHAPTSQPRVLGFVDLTFDGIGTPDMSASVLTAVSTNNTLEGTAVRTLRLGDRSPADPTIALEVMPTGLVELDNDSLVSVNPDVIQALTEAEVGALDLPAGVTSIFPYAFVVRNATSDNTRTLPASPGTDQFAGVVDFAFSIPLQTETNDDPQNMSFTLVAVDDSQTRLTQSLQEQTPPAQLALQQRADALNATTVTLLPGGTLPGVSDVRTIYFRPPSVRSWTASAPRTSPSEGCRAVQPSWARRTTAMAPPRSRRRQAASRPAKRSKSR